MTFSYWQQSDLLLKESESDFVIVGAGITGWSAAYWASRLYPKLAISLLDQTGMGAGASGRNAGFLTAGSLFYLAQLIKNEGKDAAFEFWSKKQLSLKLLNEHILQKNPQIIQHSSGSTTLFSEQELMQECQQHLAELALQVKVFSDKEVKEKGFSKAIGGLWLDHEKGIHPLELLKTFQTLCPQVKLLAPLAVYDVSCRGEKIIVHTEKGELRTKKVLLALNGYVGQLKSWTIPVTAQRAQMLAVETAFNPHKLPYLNGVCWFF